MSKCECWHETPDRKWADAECWGTRERDACSCGGDQTKCDFYPEIREGVKIKTKTNGIDRPNQFWHDAKQDPPKQNGKYLVCYNIFGNRRFQVVNYALDLAEVEPINFEGEHYPGWYEYDREYGYVEWVEWYEVLYWAKVPDVPKMTDDSFDDTRSDIQAAIVHYSRGINEDIFSPEVAKYATLAVEALRKMAKSEK